ncbi:hypothetical protein AB6A40_010437 [Gnathostoma spinigerum]|uniref:Uncharacterized protein n=1 Tax=Gnathostoma spinigerum TaxID=75299 RepID=A0ABD6F1Q9_9BILA
MKMKKAAKEDTLNMDGLKRSKVTRLKSIRNRDFTYDIDVTGEKDANRSESELTYESLASQLARLEYPHMHSSYKVTLKSHPKRMSTLMKGKRKVHFITDSAWDIRGGTC